MTGALALRALELARQAARDSGLDPAGAAVLRVASAVTVDLPGCAVVARVEPPHELATARRQVAAARLLERRGVPAVRLAVAGAQPLVRPDGVVTLWRRLRLLGGSPTPADLGRLARSLHAACAEPLPPELPELDPFPVIDSWLERSCTTPPPAGAERLAELRDRLRVGWPDALSGDPLGTVLVHGDLHADNVLLTDSGPVLADLEMAGRGPASWDLLAQETARRRYGRPAGELRAFYRAYGAALPDWPGRSVLRRAYELHLVAWAVGHRDLSPALAEQATLRTAGLLDGDARPWTLI